MQPLNLLSALLLLATSARAAQKPFKLAHLRPEIDPLNKVNPQSAHLSPLAQVIDHHHSDSHSQVVDGLPVRDPLVNFEVNVPPRVREGLESCTVTLVERSFANSYGNPSVLSYSPSKLLPAKCQDPEKWSHLVLSQVGTSRGRQFDRLGSVYLGNEAASGNGLEVWRTDNAEPVNSTGGVIWTTKKSIDQYYDVFSKDGTLIFDLPNVVDNTYTGALNVTLSLTTYLVSSKDQTPLHQQSPILYSLSKRQSNASSLFAVGGDSGGDDGVTSITIPKNTASALVEIYASGTATDEFWYSNLETSIYSEIDDAAGLGYYPRGPFREIQLLIDGQLAGFALPYPVIFTGGINPLLWRTQAAFGAYDQPNYYIDISPFIGSLTDDKAHSFQLQVYSAEKNHTIDASWFITGNLQVVLDSSNERTTGSITSHTGSRFGSFSTTGKITKGDLSVPSSFSLKSKGPRTLRIEGTVKTGSSKHAKKVVWEQSHTYSNDQTLSQNGQAVNQTASGHYKSHHDGKTFFASDFSFPLRLDLEADSTTLNATVNHQYQQTFTFGEKKFAQPKTRTIQTHQQGAALSQLNSQGQIASGVGTTSQKYSYQDSNGFTFDRETKVSNSTLVSDKTGGNLAKYAAPASYDQFKGSQNKREILHEERLSFKHQVKRVKLEDSLL